MQISSISLPQQSRISLKKEILFTILSFFTILNPIKEPKTDEEENFKYNLNQLQSYDLICTKDVAKDNAIYISTNTSPIAKTDNSNFESIMNVDFIQNKNIVMELKKSEMTSVDIYGPTNTYQIIQFNDTEPIDLGTVNICDSKKTSFKININKKSKRIFFVLIPKNNNENSMIYQSHIMSIIE